MKFIEMTGAVLRKIVNEDEFPDGAFEAAGIGDDTVVRINEQGDLEVRRPDSWDLIGGLLGDYEKRVKATTDLEWV
ncbi:MAG: hypothetical protein QF408_07655 [Pirellulales bacterium]|jgi:hypothetical protein|nr:hypothetical protein [Pirellulales bacterium]HJN66336.1 hypothetical protein [Pirellulales bacterium]